ncbi:MAG: DUF2953 domain-containing protein [Eubacteriales bacterium]
MPVPLIVIGCIILLIAAFLAMRLNVVVSYKDSLCVYAKVLFIKIPIYPQKEKEKKKKKKEKKPPEKAVEKEEDKKEEKGDKKVSPVKILWQMRESILRLIEKFFGYLHFKFIRLKITVGCEDAAKTAIAYGLTTQSVAYLIEILNNISNVDISKHSEIYVKSDFISQKSSFDGKVVLYIRVLPLFKVAFRAIKEFFKARALSSKMNGGKVNGTNEAK